MRIKGPLPPQIQERETERIPYTVTLLPSGILVAVQPYDRAHAVTYQFGIPPLHEIVPAFQPFPVRRPVVVPAFTDFQYVIQVIVLVTASDTCCQPSRVPSAVRSMQALSGVEHRKACYGHWFR